MTGVVAGGGVLWLEKVIHPMRADFLGCGLFVSRDWDFVWAAGGRFVFDADTVIP